MHYKERMQAFEGDMFAIKRYPCKKVTVPTNHAMGILQQMDSHREPVVLPDCKDLNSTSAHQL
jgi:hypothetical protein